LIAHFLRPQIAQPGRGENPIASLKAASNAIIPALAAFWVTAPTR